MGLPGISQLSFLGLGDPPPCLQASSLLVPSRRGSAQLRTGSRPSLRYLLILSLGCALGKTGLTWSSLWAFGLSCSSTFSQLLVAGGAEWAVVNSGRTLGGCGASSLLWAGAQEVGNECVRSRE